MTDTDVGGFDRGQVHSSSWDIAFVVVVCVGILVANEVIEIVTPGTPMWIWLPVLMIELAFTVLVLHVALHYVAKPYMRILEARKNDD